MGGEAEELYQRFVDRGGGTKDFSGIIKMIDKLDAQQQERLCVSRLRNACVVAMSGCGGPKTGQATMPRQCSDTRAEISLRLAFGACVDQAI